MSEYFLKLKYLGAILKAESDLSNYVTKADFKNATGVDTSHFTNKNGLGNIDSMQINWIMINKKCTK